MSVYLDIKSLYLHLKVNWNVLMCKICIARRLVVDVFPWCNANFVPFPSGTLVARRMRNGSIPVFWFILTGRHTNWSKTWSILTMYFHPIRVVEQGMCGYWVYWSTASHDINAIYSVENIRVSSIMKLTMWYCAKSHGNYLVLLPWKVGTSLCKLPVHIFFPNHSTTTTLSPSTLVYRRGGGAPPIRIIFRPAKTLNFTIKWVQLIVGSSFPVILAQTFLLSYPGVGVG